MKKVIVVDWLDKYGGAERVITSLFSIFEFKKCYTLINLMTTADLKKMLGGSKVDITTTWLKVFGNKFRYLLFLFPFFIKKITIDPDTDLIISSSHAIAKGIKKTNVRQLHICYFQARNLKYIWSETKLYFGFLHYLLYPIIVLLRRNDINNAQLPDYIIANSSYHWWGSFLSIYDRCKIFAPDLWIGGRNANFDDYKDIYRDDMTIIKRIVEV